MSYFQLKSGEKLYYEDIGSGKDTVLMLHGWTSSHYIYTESAKQIAENARCIIYDHRGHSGSKSANKSEPNMETLAKDLNELIIGLNLKEITLVGWSMGAAAVFNYIKLFGCDALKQAVICDMSPKLMNDDNWKLGLYQGKYTEQDKELDQTKNKYYQYKKFILATVPSLKKLPRLLLGRQLLLRLMKCDIPTISSLSESMQIQDNRDFAGKVTVPFTYFYPSPGSIFSPKLEKWYRDNIKTDFKSVEFPNSTHMLIIENPKRFSDEIKNLLDK